MAFSRKRPIGNDGHNMTLLIASILGSGESNGYEVDKRISEVLEGSGKTKKAISTRKAFDNDRLRKSLMDIHRRYCLVDAVDSDTEAFRHNGTVKVLSEKEKRDYIKTRNIAGAIRGNY